MDPAPPCEVPLSTLASIAVVSIFFHFVLFVVTKILQKFFNTAPDTLESYTKLLERLRKVRLPALRYLDECLCEAERLAKERGQQVHEANGQQGSRARELDAISILIDEYVLNSAPTVKRLSLVEVLRGCRNRQVASRVRRTPLEVDRVSQGLRRRTSRGQQADLGY